MTQYLLGYTQARKAFIEHPVRHTEVPVEHMVSLPLPTARWGAPGYAGFACPARRQPGQPLSLRAPDRWWALGAERGKLLGYALTSAVPFGAVTGSAAADPAGLVTVAPTERPVAAVLEDLRVLDEVLEKATGPFFAGTPGDAVLREDLRAILGAQLPPEIVPWYRALTPDFFGWLEQS